MSPLPIEQSIGRYRTLCHLATGGMAEVWLAEGPNSRGDAMVCIKLMLAGLESDQEFLSMFIEEAKLAAPLSHPNLVQIDDLGVAAGRLYLAMEYIRGHALNVVTRTLTAQGASLAPELAASLVAQACRGLDFAHNYCGPDGRPLGLVHRDVSPHNLILRDDGRLKVVDFGIAKATSRSGTRTANLKGKLGYMSPEQVHGKGIDRRSDIFSLGVTLWELATGRRLFTGGSDAEIIARIITEPIPDPREVTPEVPEELARIALCGCSRKPSRRYATAAEMAEELEVFAQTRLGGTADQALAGLAALMPALPRTVEEAQERALTAKRLPSGSLLHLAPVELGGAAARQRVDDTLADPVDAVPAAATTQQWTAHSGRGWLSVLAGFGVGLAVLGPLAFWYARSSERQSRAAAAKPPVTARPTAPDDAAAPAPQRVGYITLRTNPWSDVFLGEEGLGNTPLTRVTLPAGKHVLRLRNDRAGTFLLPVEIRPGENNDLGIVALAGLASAP